MSQARVVASEDFAKGCNLQIWLDESKPKASIERKWTVVTYDGEPDSFLFEVPPHWHKYHDEHMTVIDGELEVTAGGKKMHFKKGDTATMFRRQYHSLKCIPGKKFTLKEATDPAGDFKEEFFLDLFTYDFPGPPLFVFRTFWDGDTYPALGAPWFLGGKLIDQLMLLVVGGIGKLTQPARKPLDEMRKRHQ